MKFRFLSGNARPESRSSRSGWILARIPAWVLALAPTIDTGFADVPEAQQAEVEHLMAFVAKSDCQFVRNGKVSGNSKAVNHIKRKYRHFSDEIEDTESFIELSASKSTISGQPYIVACPDQPDQNSGDWLMAELVRFRKESTIAE